MTNLTYQQILDQVWYFRWFGYLPATTNLDQKREVLEQLLADTVANRKDEIAKLEKTVSDSVAYIEINWKQVYQVIPPNTRFYSWADLHTALKEIADANPLKNDRTYTLVQVMLHKKDGVTCRVHRFYLSLLHTNPYESEDVVFEGITEYEDTIKANQQELIENKSNKSVDILDKECDTNTQETNKHTAEDNMTNLTYQQLKDNVQFYRIHGYLPDTTKLNQKREVLEKLLVEARAKRNERIVKNTVFYGLMLLKTKSYEIYEWCYINGRELDAESIEYYFFNVLENIKPDPSGELPKLDWKPTVDAILAKAIEDGYSERIEEKYGKNETDTSNTVITENKSDKSVSESVDYIEMNWHEGYQVIKKNTRFYSWADLHTALKEIADANPLKNNVNHFKKVNVTVHKKNGKTNVRLFCLGLHKHNTDPYKSENVVFKRIPEYGETLKVNQSKLTQSKVDAEDTVRNPLQENHQNCVAVFKEFNVNPTKGAEIIAKSEVTSSEVYNLAGNTIQLQNNALDMALYGEWVNKMITSGLTSQIVSYDIWLSIRAL